MDKRRFIESAISNLIRKTRVDSQELSYALISHRYILATFTRTITNINRNAECYQANDNYFSWSRYNTS